MNLLILLQTARIQSLFSLESVFRYLNTETGISPHSPQPIPSSARDTQRTQTEQSAQNLRSLEQQEIPSSTTGISYSFLPVLSYGMLNPTDRLLKLGKNKSNQFDFHPSDGPAAAS